MYKLDNIRRNNETRRKGGFRGRSITRTMLAAFAARRATQEMQGDGGNESAEGEDEGQDIECRLQ